MSDDRPVYISITNTYNTVNRTVNTTTNNYIVVVDKRDDAPIAYRPPRVGFVQGAIEAIKALTRKKPPPSDEDELLRSV